MNSRRTGWALLGAIALALTISVAQRGEASDSCSRVNPTMPVRIRTVSPELRRALSDGIRRSPLLSSLVQRIELSDGLVYLMPGGQQIPNAGRLLGGLSHNVVVGPDYRLLRIGIWHQPGDQMIATIAHELRHAVEVLDAPEAVDQLSVKQLFERIGVRVSSAVYETEAAEHTSERVTAELSRCRS